jgi:hypothetical protein
MEKSILEIQNNIKLLTESEIINHRKIIEKGGKDVDNFEQFMKDFEKSRQDRILPFRD